MTVRRIEIVYACDQVDEEFEAALDALAAGLGLERLCSGYNFCTGTRDIQYARDIFYVQTEREE